MSEQIIRLPEVTKATGLPVSSLYKLIAKGAFPKQIRLSERSAGWLKSEVDSWLEKRIELSRKNEECRK